MGRELVGFRLTELLGAGGMAAVYRGENVLDPSIVRALKVVRPELASRPGFAKRFAREASILERLRHPNVVRFHGVRRAADGWLVMELELLRGRALSEVDERVPTSTALDWVAEAADGIAAVHALGIVHRDVKPSNLFLTDEGSVKVLDFGIARALAEGSWSTPLTAFGVVPGTPLYLAPEMIAGGEPTVASDVYSLGVVLYQLLAGHHPFAPPGSQPRSPEDLFRLRMHDPVLPRLADAPPEVSALLDGALAEKPQERFRDAAAFATAVRATRATLDDGASAKVKVAPSPPTDEAPTIPDSVAPTEVAAAPPRLPGLVAATTETAPPQEQRLEQHTWLQPAPGRHVLVGVLVGLGVIGLVVTVLAAVDCDETGSSLDAGSVVADLGAPDTSPALDASQVVVAHVPDLDATPTPPREPTADAASPSWTARAAVICERARACCLACALETGASTCGPGVGCEVASWGELGRRGHELCRAIITDWRVFLVKQRRRVPPACGGNTGLYDGHGDVDCSRLNRADYRASVLAHDIDPDSLDCDERE